tara:strand:- start:4 stop:234 length:231 start_codon:yes stop_codon:yes gene_type:complete
MQIAGMKNPNEYLSLAAKRKHPPANSNELRAAVIRGPNLAANEPMTNGDKQPNETAITKHMWTKSFCNSEDEIEMT